MDETAITDTLRKVGLRITQSRKDVLAQLVACGDMAVSSATIENRLSGIDRITLYRILKTYEEVGLIHSIADGTGKTKYAVCSEGCSPGHHHHNHMHFHCRQCDSTTCLDLAIPTTVSVPEGYEVEDMQLLVSGLCQSCSAN